jgi:Na+/glutamate symporter
MGFFFYRRAPSPLPSPAAAYPSVVAVLGFVAQSIERLVRSLAQQSSRPFLFTAFTVALLSAKVLHLYAHGKSIIFIGLLVWGPTFFAQDVLLILLARLLAGRFERQRTAIATAVVLTVLRFDAF